jgi:hypothetical protein
MQRKDVMRKRSLGHRDVDVRAVAGARRAEQRGENGGRGVHCAAQHVGDLQIR